MFIASSLDSSRKKDVAVLPDGELHPADLKHGLDDNSYGRFRRLPSIIGLSFIPDTLGARDLLVDQAQ